MKRKHLLFGIMGMYLAIISAFWLFMGIYPSVKATQDMHFFDPSHMIAEDAKPIVYSIYIIEMFLYASRVVVGILALACLIVTPMRTRFIALETAMVCMLALNLMFYGVTIGFIIRFYQPVVIYFLSRKWCAYQEQLIDQGIDRKREYFPFVKEFVRYRECK